jgi:hypothetical protein
MLSAFGHRLSPANAEESWPAPRPPFPVLLPTAGTFWPLHSQSTTRSATQSIANHVKTHSGPSKITSPSLRTAEAKDIVETLSVSRNHRSHWPSPAHRRGLPSIRVADPVLGRHEADQGPDQRRYTAPSPGIISGRSDSNRAGQTRVGRSKPLNVKAWRSGPRTSHKTCASPADSAGT